MCGRFSDYLQAPLQPLMDNLESQTYEAFEKDPVKYAQYEKAIVKALQLEKTGDVTVLMVSCDPGWGVGGVCVCVGGVVRRSGRERGVRLPSLFVDGQC